MMKAEKIMGQCPNLTRVLRACILPDSFDAVTRAGFPLPLRSHK